MDRIELIAPCHFGLEAVLKREILELGYEIARVEDGRVTNGFENFKNGSAAFGFFTEDVGKLALKLFHACIVVNGFVTVDKLNVL